MPRAERRRPCIEAILSTDETLNSDVTRCADLEEVKMYKNCNIGPCPIDAKWSNWPSDWSSCSGKCKVAGESVPKKSRSRTCIPEAYGGRNCSHLEGQARGNNELLDKEVQDCSDLPNCPRPATLGSWGDWSSCGQTCFPVGQPMTQRVKRRSCNEAILSIDETLNTGVVTCKDFNDVKKYKNCNIPACPIDATWSSWSPEWSSCSANCKKRWKPVPQKSRSRTCIPEVYGGKNCSILESQAIESNQFLFKSPILYKEEQGFKGQSL